MTNSPQKSPDEYSETREHEYQDPHYHDEEPEIADDEQVRHLGAPPATKKKPTRRPPPRRWYEED